MPGICEVAEGIRWELIEPILECCSADGLLRIEQSSPVSVKVYHKGFEQISFRIHILSPAAY